MNAPVLITGISSGLGNALAETYLENGTPVYGLGRRRGSLDHPDLHFAQTDLLAPEQLSQKLHTLLETRPTPELVILNAGILGEINDLQETPLYALKEIMDVNVWANKVIIDTLTALNRLPKQIVAISSGAAINGHRGWGGYSLSKAALNMLIRLYAGELPHVHCTALAPGVISTPMVAHILTHADPKKYPSATRLKEAPKRTPKEAARLLLATFPKLLSFPSGEFLDIRTLPEMPTG